MKTTFHSILALSLLFLVACSNENPNVEAPKPTEVVKQKSKLPSAVYRFYANKENDLNCEESKPWICVSLQEFKYFCANAIGFTKGGENSAITKEGVRDKGASYLIENGVVPIETITWQENEKFIEQSCLIEMIVEGQFEGSQYKKTFETYSNTFIVNSDDKILVHSTFTIY
jgi:hypothetical protein